MSFYITTTLPYVNAEPHIGHTLEFIQADVIARYFRKKLGKDQVFFNLGTDEHGLKMYQKAQELDVHIQEFVDTYAQRFKDFCEDFHISYDNFYRTSTPEHTSVAQAFRQRSLANGDIYKKKYTGLYCVGCESFKTPKDLIDGKCPDHNKEPEHFEEENYFFKLSNHREKLLQYIEDNKSFIKPATKIKELENFVKKMDDISISRLKENLPRGVPVPGDDDQVMYVRFDALSNYVGAAGFPHDMQRFDNTRPAVQICGPDNLRFQGAIRQGMLASAQIPFSKNILVHGMIQGSDGNKMSKTLGNVISPFDQLEKYGHEAVRFYMINGIPTYGNAAYKEEDLVNICNSCMADSFGNLLNRVIHLANKKEVEINNFEKVSEDIQTQVQELENKITTAYENFELQDASGHVHQLALLGNKYIDENQPRAKEKTPEEVETILNNTSFILSKICHYYEPIIPVSAQKAQEALEKKEKIILFEKIGQ